MGTEIAWEFMRDLGLFIFAAGGALFALGFSRTLLRELGATNVTLITTIGDAMMLAGACPARRDHVMMRQTLAFSSGSMS